MVVRTSSLKRQSHVSFGIFFHQAERRPIAETTPTSFVTSKTNHGVFLLIVLSLVLFGLVDSWRQTSFFGTRSITTFSMPLRHDNHSLDTFLPLSVVHSWNGTRTPERLIYVHVGKTGGQTLDLALRSNCMWHLHPDKRQNCIQVLEEQGKESQVSLQTILTIHCNPRQKLDPTFMEQITGYLITIRNPVTRVISSFNTGHPYNKNSTTKLRRKKRLKLNLSPLDQQFYVECFPTMQDLATTLQRGNQSMPSPSNKQECYQLGVKALQGQWSKKTAGHLAMNYGHYDRMLVSKFPKRQGLWIVRTEHLWQDLSRIDQLLGGSGYFAHAGEAKTHNSETYTVRQGLSGNSASILCCYMVQEFQIYENWLRQSVNLQPVEKTTTMEEIYNQCGVGDPEKRLHQLSTGSFSWLDWVKSNKRCSTILLTEGW